MWVGCFVCLFVGWCDIDLVVYFGRLSVGGLVWVTVVWFF